ncbi:ATP phosphoribosyltransferase regulatory subunit [Paralimibaculum aggregatum]|uniref:ATP phosphoribosyltransferase regulatory subunit n=1 Tax=Paralimibaculum aggregatum TaxID=3036245 RepID=A0ABQ6LHP2_9RHOB|nr:ATP phosphoribosyltransferase regulatory subunit [Limibaculum sp. NKW23]GMG82802.1 ATP phosphoribosyltransferase regulatory subunit [Limibaculum sp. NKW23]
MVDCLTGAALAARDDAVARLRALFAEEGYVALEPRHLLDADVLLDLYGEDIRTRAFIFPEPVTAGELCLRPDFTVPVAMAHGDGGWNRRAAYAYAGPVFRLQDRSGRPIEYLQAGIERYGDADRGAADAAVLALTLRGLEALGCGAHKVSTGDTGIFLALIDALEMPARRKAALRRHFWRPARFKALIEGFTAAAPEPGAQRRALLAAAAEGPEALDALAADGREVLGARGLEEVAARAEALAAAADEPRMPAEQAALIEAVLSVHGPSGEALARLRELTAAAGLDLLPALERFEVRLDALNRIGIDAEELPFDARFGRMLEYYDGFVFEIEALRPGLPPLAGGGRYDRMTRRLGAAEPVPAIGAMIRPEVALAAAGEG